MARPERAAARQVLPGQARPQVREVVRAVLIEAHRSNVELEPFHRVRSVPGLDETATQGGAVHTGMTTGLLAPKTRRITCVTPPGADYDSSRRRIWQADLCACSHRMSLAADLVEQLSGEYGEAHQRETGMPMVPSPAPDGPGSRGYSFRDLIGRPRFGGHRGGAVMGDAESGEGAEQRDGGRGDQCRLVAGQGLCRAVK
jgi:hypothetical protein